MRVIFIIYLLSLAACEAHRLGAQVNWEYGTATDKPSSMEIGGEDEKDSD